MRLHDIVDTSRRVAEASGRREKIEHLATCIRHAPANRVETVVGYLSGEPPQGRLGIGPAMLRDANPDAAAGSPRLTIDEVHGVFEQIVEARGPGATGQRVRLLRDLLRRATAEEQSFLRRLVIGELRQGALEGLMVDAVARAAGIPARQVRRATMVSGELGPVARIALTEGSTGLSRLAIRTFRPVKPMLAQPADDIADALDRLGEAALEYKMDGARVQVHKSGGDVAVFTRRLNDVSQSVPEIVEAARGLAVREIILDGEALAFRRDGQPHPFQVTMRRFGRKTDVARLRETLPL
ncbi:MAG: ATP-dependent DNA ligase, partial [Alphaproteobacteria bacterium]